MPDVYKEARFSSAATAAYGKCLDGLLVAASRRTTTADFRPHHPAGQQAIMPPDETGTGPRAMAPPEPQESNDFLVAHAMRLVASHWRLTGRALLPEGTAAGVARGALPCAVRGALA